MKIRDGFSRGELVFRKELSFEGFKICHGGGGSTNTIQNSEPWAGFQGPLNNYIQRADALSSQPYQGYTGQLYAPLNNIQNQAVSQTQSMNYAGTPKVLNDASSATSDILNGSQFLNSPGLSMSNPYAGVNNPYTDQAIQQAQNDTIRGYQTATAPSLDAQANMAGAFGGSGWQTAKTNNEMALGNTLAKQASDLRMNDYNTQIGLAESGLNRAQTAFDNAATNQIRAGTLAPTIANSAYGIDQNNLNNLWNAGNQVQNNSQNMLNEQQNKVAQQNAWPYTSLDILGNALNKSQGGYGSISGSQSASTNPYTTAAGVGMAALGVYGAGASAGLWGGSTAASLLPLLF